MCETNQPELGLSNGDTGIILEKDNMQRVLFNVFSEERTLTARLINPARIKKTTPAYAITVHKAQGSEANQVVLLWPNISNSSRDGLKKDAYNEKFKRKLLYTAITRAKSKLKLFLDQEIISSIKR